MKKKSSKVQVNVPLDPETAQLLLIWAAYQDKTRGRFIRDLLQNVALAIGDIGAGLGTIEVQAVRETNEE